jgi:hypothetical protein
MSPRLQALATLAGVRNIEWQRRAGIAAEV